MVQREVADRVTASPGSRDYGLLSVTVQMFGPADALLHAASRIHRAADVTQLSSAGGSLPASLSSASKEAPVLTSPARPSPQKRQNARQQPPRCGIWLPQLSPPLLAHAALNPRPEQTALH